MGIKGVLKVRYLKLRGWVDGYELAEVTWFLQVFVWILYAIYIYLKCAIRNPKSTRSQNLCPVNFSCSYFFHNIGSSSFTSPSLADCLFVCFFLFFLLFKPGSFFYILSFPALHDFHINGLENHHLLSFLFFTFFLHVFVPLSRFPEFPFHL